jgi:hypothetical protein
MGSSLLDFLGRGHIVYGKINASQATDTVITSNDGSATLTRVAAGEYTVTFGDVFTAVPIVVGCPVVSITTATVSTDCPVVTLESVSTAAVTFNILDVVGGTDATDAVQADHDFYFVAIGSRDN